MVQRKRSVYRSSENKIKAVKCVLQDQIPIRQGAEEIDVSLASIQQWLKQYKDYGPKHFLKNKKNVERNPVMLVDKKNYSV